MIAIIKRLMLAVVLPAALVVGCGGGTKKQDPTTNTHSSSTPAAHYRMGESCKSNEDLAYSAQGFVCKNGKLAAQVVSNRAGDDDPSAHDHFRAAGLLSPRSRLRSASGARQVTRCSRYIGVTGR